MAYLGSGFLGLRGVAKLAIGLRREEVHMPGRIGTAQARLQCQQRILGPPLLQAEAYQSGQGSGSVGRACNSVINGRRRRVEFPSLQVPLG